MAWLPWAELPKRSNITPYELIDWLRYRAIELGAPPLFIDAIEGLGSAELSETATQEIQELENELTTVTDERDDLKRVLKNLLADRENDEAIDEAQAVLDGM